MEWKRGLVVASASVGSAVCSNRQEGRGEPRGHVAPEAEGGGRGFGEGFLSSSTVPVGSVSTPLSPLVVLYTFCSTTVLPKAEVAEGKERELRRSANGGADPRSQYEEGGSVPPCLFAVGARASSRGMRRGDVQDEIV